MPGHACALTSRFAVMDIVREAELTGLRDHDTQGANDLEQCGAVQSMADGQMRVMYHASRGLVATLARQLDAPCDRLRGSLALLLGRMCILIYRAVGDATRFRDDRRVL
jgi:hypothetical protein